MLEVIQVAEKSALLEIEDVTKDFGGLRALSKVSFSVMPEEIKALIGPNGAGKTTLFNVITKSFPATSGKVKFKGEDITKVKPHDVAKRGILRTFQNLRLFGDMTVLENVVMGCHRVTRTGLLSAAFSLPEMRRTEQWVKKHAMECLRFVGLEKEAFNLTGDLPYGTQKMVELARALASEPDLLLADEPATGLNDLERDRVSELFLRLREKGLSIILVEHQMDFVMKLSHRIVVLNYGQKIAEGTPDEIQKNSEVIAAYLGVE